MVLAVPGAAVIGVIVIGADRPFHGVTSFLDLLVLSATGGLACGGFGLVEQLSPFLTAECGAELLDVGTESHGGLPESNSGSKHRGEISDPLVKGVTET